MLFDSQTPAANTKVSGIFKGNLHEYVPYNCMVSIYASSGAINDSRMTVNIGGEVCLDDQLIPNSNRYPIRPDDLILQHPARKGDRLIVDIRTTVTSQIIKTMAVLDPV